jgi:hypothetical protein
MDVEGRGLAENMRKREGEQLKLVKPKSKDIY